MREDHECPQCGHDCDEMGRHAFDDVTVLWYFTCEKCGIDFGGDSGVDDEKSVA